MEKAASAFGKLLEALALLGCAVIFLMTVMICADVLLRNVRLIPGVYGIAWSNEVSEAMLYLVTMLTAPWLLRKGQHIRVDIVLRAVPPKLGWYFEWISDSLGLVLLPGDRLVRRPCGARELQLGRDVHQDAGDAGVVDAHAPADCVPAACHRDGLPHAAAQSRRTRAARRRSLDGLSHVLGPPPRG